MDASSLAQRIFRVEIRRLLFITGFLVAVIVVSQCFSSLYISPADKGSSTMTFASSGRLNESKSSDIRVVPVVVNDSNSSDSEHETESKSSDIRVVPVVVNDSNSPDSEHETESKSRDIRVVQVMVNGSDSPDSEHETEAGLEDTLSNELALETDIDSGKSDVYETQEEASDESNEKKRSDPIEAGVELVPRNSSLADFEERFKRAQAKDSKISENSTSEMVRKYEAKLRGSKPTTLSQMTSILLRSSVSSSSMKPRWSSARDRDLWSAKLEIDKAPIVRSSGVLSDLVFRNVSKFIRSYELMEKVLKVYVYKEGDKPIFHQPYMRGIYASEGWFMKLMEANKKFVVRDPKKAHLFYLPFSSTSLRFTLNRKDQFEKKNLEKYLKRYVDSIAKKYRFWNRTNGADHFLVACHDWASYLTRKTMKNCVRSLCNANVAKGFKIGKDASFPVTYVKSAEAPLANVGGRPASERPFLAFFAGGPHGYLRPILLSHWENREPDMKIFGPMPRDAEGKQAYREYMKSSRYCVCARGYEVHTPRIVESIFHECVPVILSDNYVPPFFEVLDWEAFSVFVKERDVADLRDILLSIPQERYESLQLGVKMVQKHFFWHKTPLKYDLFHMTLHSIWNNRLIQL